MYKTSRLAIEENRSQTQGFCRPSHSPRTCQTSYGGVRRRHGGAEQRHLLIENSREQNFHQRRNTGVLQAHIQSLTIGAPQLWQCIDCFKTFFVGKAFVGFEQYAMIAFSNIFNLLNNVNMIQCITIAIALCSTATSLLASSSTLNTRLFGVNMLGGHCMPWATALIPAETESEHTYTEVYKASLLTLPSCGGQECKSCSYIKELIEN